MKFVVLLLLVVWCHGSHGAFLTPDTEELARQLMLQQFYTEERIRTEGASGIKQIRITDSGTRVYHVPDTKSSSVISMHNHANYRDTLGLGEFVAVLNGVEFATRHNDYKLHMPSRYSTDYHAVQQIPYPDVPPEVTSKLTVEDQIEEMKQWFIAFRDQDYSVRDYRKYFRPVLCYLEGAWSTNTHDLEESFESDRHRLEASSWLDMQEKIRFMSYAGRKDSQENLAYLPTTILQVKNNRTYMAQWNYRILCHPLKDDLPLNRFRVVDDITNRMSHQRVMYNEAKSRAARFQLNPADRDEFRHEGHSRRGLLDELMEQIPGKDNYKANLVDDAFDLTAYYLKGKAGQNELLNAGYYHRWYKVQARGAMGLAVRHRGYSDQNVFMAMTSRPEVAGMSATACKKRRKLTCKTADQKWTYAVPLEIVYTTPLTKWNPYDIEYKGSPSGELGRTVKKGGRDGGFTPEKAYNGTNRGTFMQVPAEFFGKPGDGDPADTTGSARGVLDKQGNVRKCAASGHRIFIPVSDAKDQQVGAIRQRYPIAPLHTDGDSVRKEVEALKDIILNLRTYAHMLHERILFPPDDGSLMMGMPFHNDTLLLELVEAPEDLHTHFVELNSFQIQRLKSGEALYVDSSFSQGHIHNIKLIYVTGPRGLNRRYVMDLCDGHTRCEHDRNLKKIRS